MAEPVRIGIIICDRYRTCAGGKCLRALRTREGAFGRYRGQQVGLESVSNWGLAVETSPSSADERPFTAFVFPDYELPLTRQSRGLR